MMIASGFGAGHDQRVGKVDILGTQVSPQVTTSLRSVLKREMSLVKHILAVVTMPRKTFVSIVRSPKTSYSIKLQRG
jgi:hypothetical protein